MCVGVCAFVWGCALVCGGRCLRWHTAGWHGGFSFSSLASWGNWGSFIGWDLFQPSTPVQSLTHDMVNCLLLPEVPKADGFAKCSCGLF